MGIGLDGYLLHVLTLTLLGSKPGLEVICVISDLIIVEFFYFNMQFPQITERKIYSCSHKKKRSFKGSWSDLLGFICVGLTTYETKVV